MLASSRDMPQIQSSKGDGSSYVGPDWSYLGATVIVTWIVKETLVRGAGVDIQLPI
jgi:hypothetical protein